jgi:cytochrome P450
MTDLLAHGRSVPGWIQALTVAELDDDTDAIFTRLRRESPLSWIPVLNAWIATTWELCDAIATDPENFKGGDSPLMDRLFGVPNIVGAEGDLHASLRAVVDQPLSPRAFRDQLESHVRPVARAALEPLRDRRGAELMADYFEPVSVRCVADVFGFDVIPTAQLRSWFHALAVASANTTDETGQFPDPHAFDTADGVRAEVRRYLESFAEQERANPDNGHFSRLFRAGLPAGRMRSPEELLPSFLIVFLGGLQEPGHACGATFLALATHPETRQQVLDDLRLLPRAIAEALRWMSPLYGGAIRIAARDLTYAGQELRQGEAIWLAYGSANHDEGVFEAGGQYSLTRTHHPNLAFGTGRHRCPGSAFAPQVARIALEELYREFPSIRLDPARPPAPKGWLFRGARELHSVW